MTEVKKLSEEEMLALLDIEDVEVSKLIEEVSGENGKFSFAKKVGDKWAKISEGKYIIIDANMDLKKSEHGVYGSIIVKYLEESDEKYVLYTEYVTIPSTHEHKIILENNANPNKKYDRSFKTVVTNFKRYISKPLGTGDKTSSLENVKLFMSLIRETPYEVEYKLNEFAGKDGKLISFIEPVGTMKPRDDLSDLKTEYKEWIKKVEENKAKKKEAEAGLVQPERPVTPVGEDDAPF